MIQSDRGHVQLSRKQAPRSPRRWNRRLVLLLFSVLMVTLYVWHSRQWMTQIANNNSYFTLQTFGHAPEMTPSNSVSNVALYRTTTATSTVSHPSHDDNKVGKEPSHSQSVTKDPFDEGVENGGLLSMIYGARYANGTLGYVADPTALRQGVASFLNELVDNDTRLAEESYWKLLMGYETIYRNGTFSGNEVLSPDFICAPGPGRGYEQDYGYKLLTEKIRMHPRSSSPNESSPKLLCLVYTYPKMRDLQRTQALSWGLKCDGYLAFSTETIANLGALHLEHAGDESYDNMWQKVRSIWFYVYKHYRNDYDFFHLGGDDVYVIVENLRKFLSETLKRRANGDEIYLGQWIPQPGDKPYYVSGGPGYTLNRAALVRLVKDALPTCRAHMRVSYEDRLVSQCLREIGIIGGDTRDRATGEQLYHDCGPAHLYTFRSTTGRGSFHAKAASYWETLSSPNSTQKVGPKHGLDAAGKYSVAFHDIYHPLYVARLHSILYPATCPATSPLGRALYAHSQTTTKA